MSQFRFPDGFNWGVATSAYQIEGGWNADGKGASIWDNFAHTPGKIAHAHTGDRACDSYHRLAEDLDLLAGLGVKMYRFSISWPRIYPSGRDKINQAGLDYYSRLVDGLLERGIQAFCTLYHWDLPQALQDEGGWETRATIAAYVDFAQTMFKVFQGRIQHWITFNEPFCSAFVGNYFGIHAPGNQDLQTALTVAHHILVAHGRTVKVFRELVANGEASGEIGIAPNLTWAVPYSDTEADRLAALRAVQWSGDWFLDPIWFGHYPEELLSWFADRGFAPPVQPGDFTEIRRDIDFIGCNYYAARLHRFNPEAGIIASEELNMGLETSDIGWPYEPAGFHDSLLYTVRKYGPVPLYITENGVCINDGPSPGEPPSRVPDQRRIAYLHMHLASLHRAIANGADVRGYMAWSLLDNFEWAEGYGMRFGLVHVDFSSGQRRPKDSYHWYALTIGQNGLS